MDVYFNGNGMIWGKSRHGKKLTAFPIQKTFLWEGQEIFLPAVYVGKAGAILDVCIKIPMEDMISFLKKWDKKRRRSLKSPEDYEQMEFEHPCCIKFSADMSLNDEILTFRMSGSLMWYPTALDDELKNDKDAEKLMTDYDCDRSCCWYFGRLFYCWNEAPVLCPKQISLVLREEPYPVTAAYFTTDLSCCNEVIKIVHPKTGQEFVLTLHECREEKCDFSGIGEKGMCYPQYCQILSYSVSPEPKQNLLDIIDCTEGDSPKRNSPKRVEDTSVLAESSGPTAVFMAGKSSVPDRRAACSSLHFEPVSNVRWRLVFQVTTRSELKIENCNLMFSQN